jgi:CRISPR/Cas system-associated exonuclease Cas4 (RecB family)
MVHAAISAYVKTDNSRSVSQRASNAQDFSTMDEDLEYLKQLFRDIWKKERNKLRQQAALTLNRNDEMLYGKKGLQMLENYYRSTFSSKPYETEKYLDAPLGTDISFVGRVDRIEKNADGFRIVDFKTGKFSERYVDFLQLNTYSWLAYNYGLRVDSTLFYYLEENEIVQREFSDDVCAQTEATLKQKCCAVLEAVHANRFSKRNGPLCRYCDYTDLCRGTEEKTNAYTFSVPIG